MKKSKLKEYKDKYWCVKKKRESWAEFKHRVEVEREIEKFLHRSRKRTYFDLHHAYDETYRPDIVTEALTKLSKLVLFERSVTAYHGLPVIERTRCLLIAFLHLHDKYILVDWYMYRYSPSSPLSLYGIPYDTKVLKKACKYRILWYLLSKHVSTTVVLPVDDGGGVLRKIVEFII